ncbi:hypothetical protein [Chondromyces apiculatus]|nr:hypothetical protein [Chondromyces apiculatus]
MTSPSERLIDDGFHGDEFSCAVATMRLVHDEPVANFMWKRLSVAKEVCEHSEYLKFKATEEFPAYPMDFRACMLLAEAAELIDPGEAVALYSMMCTHNETLQPSASEYFGWRATEEELDSVRFAACNRLKVLKKARKR